MTQGSRLYRTLVAEGTTHLDLLLATYDALAEDLRLSANAAEAGNIADRCKWSHHAMLLLGHLESWIPLLEEKPLEQSLAQFYVYIRAELLRLQSQPDSASFLALSLKVCEARAAWQQKTTRGHSTPELLLPDNNDTGETPRLSLSA